MTTKEAFINWNKAVANEIKPVERALAGLPDCTVSMGQCSYKKVREDKEGFDIEFIFPVQICKRIHFSQADLSNLGQIGL